MGSFEDDINDLIDTSGKDNGKMTHFIKITDDNQELYHFGVKGMRWGHTKTGYRSTSIRSAIARRQNDATDAGFKDWKVNADKKQDAVVAGKKRNEAKRAYESDRSNKQLKADYKTADKEYKKALSKNTTYRKGVVKQEVGKDMSRKYLSDAKKLKKQIDAGQGTDETKKQYQRLMNQYDIERASARRAVAVASKRSQKKASMKRAMTMSVKAAVATAAVAAGSQYINSRLVAQGKQPVDIPRVINFATKAKDFMGYF